MSSKEQSPELRKVDEFISFGMPESMSEATISGWDSLGEIDKLRMQISACAKGLEVTEPLSENGNLPDYHRTGMQFGKNGHKTIIEVSNGKTSPRELTHKYLQRLMDKYTTKLQQLVENDIVSESA